MSRHDLLLKATPRWSLHEGKKMGNWSIRKEMEVSPVIQGSRGAIPRHIEESTTAEITKVGIKLSELLAPNVQIGIIPDE